MPNQTSGLGLQWSPLTCLYKKWPCCALNWSDPDLYCLLLSTHARLLERTARVRLKLSERYSVHFCHHCCRQWRRRCAYDAGDETWEHDERPSDSWNATLTYPVWAHPVSLCPSELNPYIHQSYTLCYTHKYTQKNSLPSKCKQKLKIIGTLSLPLEDRRKKDILHIVKSTIIAA